MLYLERRRLSTDVLIPRFALCSPSKHKAISSRVRSELARTIFAAQPTRLLDHLRQAACRRRASKRTTAERMHWVRAYVLLHGKGHARARVLPDALSRCDTPCRPKSSRCPRWSRVERPSHYCTARSVELMYGTFYGHGLGRTAASPAHATARPDEPAPWGTS